MKKKVFLNLAIFLRAFSLILFSAKNLGNTDYNWLISAYSW